MLVEKINKKISIFKIKQEILNYCKTEIKKKNNNTNKLLSGVVLCLDVKSGQVEKKRKEKLD